MNGLGVFAAYFVLDLVWVVYTRGIARNRALPACGAAFAIPLLSGSAIIAATHNPWLLVWAGAGGAVGTLVAMRIK